MRRPVPTSPTSASALSFGRLALLAAALGLAGASARAQDAGPEPAPAPALPPAPRPDAPSPEAADAAAAAKIHQYQRIAPNLVRGEQPEGDEDFAALAAAGIKSIISVDGASPDVETAKKYGLRYVHIPIGYDGIPPEKALQLAKAYQVLGLEGGGIYVHCHHGKHRGPAASGIGLCVLAGKAPADAVADMKRAGTDPKYAGLYRSVEEFKLPTAEELAAVPADLPSVAPVSGLAAAMVAVDATWERLKQVKKAAWAAPKDHPDVEPAHEATILAEAYRELARLEQVAQEPEAFRTHLAQSEAAAWDLAKALEKGRVDAGAAAAAFTRVQASCTACHAAFRDNVHRSAPVVPAK